MNPWRPLLRVFQTVLVLAAVVLLATGMFLAWSAGGLEIKVIETFLLGAAAILALHVTVRIDTGSWTGRRRN